MTTMDLVQYLSEFGNPLLQGHSIVPCLTKSDGMRLAVAVPLSMIEKGRYPLKAHVDQACVGMTITAPLQRLSAMHADNLEDVKVGVSHC